MEKEMKKLVNDAEIHIDQKKADELRKLQHTKASLPNWIFFTGKNKDKKSVDVTRLSKAIYQKYGKTWQLIINNKGKFEFYQYNHELGYWYLSNVEMIQTPVTDYLKKYHIWSQSAENQTMQLLRSSLKKDIKDYRFFNYEAPNLVNFQDSVLDLTTMETLSHKANYRFTGVVPYPIKGMNKDKTTLAEKWLVETLGKDGALTLMQYIGYMFYPTYSTVQAVMFLYGKGGDGKDHIFSLIRRIIGADYVKNFRLNDLAGENSRFNVVELKGKRVNLISEIDEKEKLYAINTGLIKNLTGGGQISAQQKGLKSEDFYPHAKILIAVNDLPKTNDTSTGWVRRLYILKAHKIKGFESKYPSFGDDMSNISNDDLASLALKCIYLYQQQVKAEKERKGQYIRLSESKEAKEDKKEYIKNSDIVQSFIDDKHYTVTHNEKDFIFKDNFYNSFKKWCEDFGFGVIDYNDLNRQMKNKDFNDKRKVRNGSRKLAWLGILDHGSIKMDDAN